MLAAYGYGVAGLLFLFNHFKKPIVMDDDRRMLLLDKFLTSTDQTGRFIVVSKRTGRKYFVEPIAQKESESTQWGDVNPATKKVEGDYGDKYKGSIDKSQSLITEENGFNEIHETGVGVSPLSYIEKLDAQYPDKQEGA